MWGCFIRSQKAICEACRNGLRLRDCTGDGLTMVLYVRDAGQNPPDTRLSDHEANMLSLLKAIRRAEPVARTDLVELTGLAAGTVSALTGDFLKHEILIEDRVPNGGRGRPRLDLRINPDKTRVASACILSSGQFEVDIANLRGDTLYSRTVELARSPSLENLAERISDTIASVIADSPVRKNGIRCVGLGMPAIIDKRQGIVHEFGTFPDGPVPLARIMERRLRLPVVLDNTANILARAEHWFGDRRLDNFTLVILNIGVGYSQYLGGELSYGAQSRTSGFAHIKVAFEDGRACICGAKGCLAAYASAYGVVRQIFEAEGRRLPKLTDTATARKAIREVADRAESGDLAACAAFEKAGTVLGVALANQINLGSPSPILIFVVDAALAKLISAPLRTALHENVAKSLRDQTQVEFRIVEKEHYSRGAAALVLEQLYKDL